MLKPLKRIDAARAAELHLAGFESAWGIDDLTRHINNDIALGYFKTSLRGFILIQAAADQAEILTITVDPADRQSGIGLQLLSAGEQAAIKRGAEILFLEVAEDNAPAIALYHRAGYESFGIRPAYYRRAGGRVAARLFRKNLTAPT